MNHNESFNQVLNMLNPSQKQVVETVEGAVMVQAGPGTGKTATISARVGMMLTSKTHQIDPQSILILTFTDAGATALRQRLLEFIGATAYQVTINTFHAFANQVIQDNKGYFGFNDVEPVSMLEEINIAEGIIDKIADSNPLKRLNGNQYFEVSRMLNLFHMMKQEDWTVEYVHNICAQYMESMPLNEKYIYKRGNKKRGIQAGDPNQTKIKADVEKLTKLLAAVSLFDIYNEELARRKRYTFDDMIKWVIDAFRNNEGILLNYQEQYQYVISDESQDNSGAQAEMISLLMNYWENPNVMYMLDKKQCIYEFSGARIENINEFKRKYSPQMFTLDRNYRSTQEVVNTATSVIEKSTDGSYDKEDIEGMNKNTGEIKIHLYKNFMHETTDVYNRITSLLSKGADPSDIAVIYRKHTHSEELLRLLYKDKVPIQTRRKINVLEEQVIKQIITILYYLSGNVKKEESDLFFQILHFDFLGVMHRQIERLLILLRDGGTIKELDARMFNTVNGIMKLLDELESDLYNYSILHVLEKIYYKTGLKDFILKNKDARKAIALKSFFDWVKTEAADNPDLDVTVLLENIRRMNDHHQRVEVEDVIGQEDGVFFTTAHGSKGLEWKYVFMIRSNRSDWENARVMTNRYFMPETLTFARENDKIEAARRLFFVSMTRAKEFLYMSYSEKDNKGKDMEPSQFLIESEVDTVEIPQAENLTEVVDLMVPQQLIFTPKVEENRINSVLDNFRISPSNLNLYLRCPLSFYYEKVLRIPYVQSFPALYGSACHFAIEQYYKNDLNVDDFIQQAINYMDNHGAILSNKEKGRMVKLFRKMLPAFFQNYLIMSNKIVVNEYKVRDVIIDGVPIYGEIDKLEFEGNVVDVIDYKTGNPINIKKKLKQGEPYWRQLIFYKILVNNNYHKNWETKRLGVVTINDTPEFIPIEVSAMDVSVVKDDIRLTYKRIKNHEFNGCGDDDCKWCSLVK